jgi:tetratricopeptide (TPR) repeat protein
VLARYYGELGFVATLKGDPAAAVAHYEKALALYRRGEADTDALRMLINLAHVTWALGDLDTALARCHETIGLLRQLQPKNNLLLAFTLAYVMGIQTERGEIDEALTAATESLPLLDEAGCAWSVLDDFALLAALCDKPAGAARAVGYTDATYAAKTASRPPHVAQSRAKVEALLSERLPSEEREQLLAQGAKMTEHEACCAVLK